MPFLVRKMMKSDNIHSLINCESDKTCDISADVTTREFKTESSKLSVWQIDDEWTNMDEAVLAIIMGSQRIETINIIFFNIADLGSDFEIIESPGNTAVSELKNMHRDICGIKHSDLDLLLKIYKAAVDNNQYKRYRTKELKNLAKSALENGRIDYGVINNHLKEDIDKLKTA